MKKNYIILSVIVLSAGVFSFQKNEETSKISKLHILNSGGKNGLFAGAPGDDNCTACHSGTAQSGASVNTLTIATGITPVSSYTVGSTYNVALTMSGSPLRTGFQAVAMNSSNAMVGTIAAVSGTQILTGRVTHTSSAPVNWTWTWTAPGTDVGDVTFYVATLSGKGATNQTGGDIVYLSQTVLASPSANLLEKFSDKYNFTAGYSSSSNSVVMDFNSLVSGEMYFNLVDMNGRSVFTYGLGQSVIGKNSEKIVLPEDLKNGMYVVNMFVNNNVMEKKIMIQK